MVSLTCLLFSVLRFFPQMDLFDYFLTLSGGEVSGKWAMGGPKGFKFSLAVGSTESNFNSNHVPAEGLVVGSSYADKVSIQRRKEGPWERLIDGPLEFEPVFAVKWELVRKNRSFIYGTFVFENDVMTASSDDSIKEYFDYAKEAAIAELELEIEERKAAIKFLSEITDPIALEK